MSTKESKVQLEGMEDVKIQNVNLLFALLSLASLMSRATAAASSLWPVPDQWKTFHQGSIFAFQ